jgi:hypothetical protein
LRNLLWQLTRRSTLAPTKFNAAEWPTSLLFEVTSREASGVESTPALDLHGDVD